MAVAALSESLLRAVTTTQLEIRDGHAIATSGADLAEDSPPLPDRLRGNRAGRASDDRRESGVGRAAGDRLGERAGAVRPAVDRSTRSAPCTSLAKKFDVPVCPHAGGMGLCELVQHLSIFDYVAVSGTLENRITEDVDHLHEHFVDPCVVDNGAYRVPTAPGYSAQIRPESLEEFRFPDG